MGAGLKRGAKGENGNCQRYPELYQRGDCKGAGETRRHSHPKSREAFEACEKEFRQPCPWSEALGPSHWVVDVDGGFAKWSLPLEDLDAEVKAWTAAELPPFVVSMTFDYDKGDYVEYSDGRMRSCPQGVSSDLVWQAYSASNKASIYAEKTAKAIMTSLYAERTAKVMLSLGEALQTDTDQADVEIWKALEE